MIQHFSLLFIMLMDFLQCCYIIALVYFLAVRVCNGASQRLMSFISGLY